YGKPSDNPFWLTCGDYDFRLHVTSGSDAFCRMGLSPLANSFIDTSSLSGTSTVAIGCAGLPCTIVLGGTDLVTTLPAVTIAPRPIVTFGNTITPAPSEASSSINTPRCSRLWAIIVTLMPTAARSRMLTRCGQQVSIIVS